MNVLDLTMVVIQVLLSLVILRGLAKLLDIGEIIMANQAAAAQQVRDLTVTINKIGTETAATLDKVKALQEIIDAGNGGEVSAELQTAINEAIASAKATDDLTPDAP